MLLEVGIAEGYVFVREPLEGFLARRSCGRELVDEDAAQMMEIICKYVVQLPGDARARFEEAYKLMADCGAGWKRAVIAADGSVYPCPLFPREERWLMGRIDEEPSRVFGSRLSRVFARLSRLGGELCKGCRYEG